MTTKRSAVKDEAGVKETKPLDGIVLVRSVFGQQMSEQEAGYILWNKTGWPWFYVGDPATYFRKQLRHLKRAYKLGRDVCACCGKIRLKSQMPDGAFCKFFKWDEV